MLVCAIFSLLILFSRLLSRSPLSLSYTACHSCLQLKHTRNATPTCLCDRVNDDNENERSTEREKATGKDMRKMTGHLLQKREKEIETSHEPSESGSYGDDGGHWRGSSATESMREQTANRVQEHLDNGSSSSSSTSSSSKRNSAKQRVCTVKRGARGYTH